MSLPDPAPVTDLIEAFRRSKTMFTAVELGVFELLHAGPANAAAVARALKTNEDATARLLDSCAALGLVVKDDGIYGNSPAAEAYLCAGSANSLRGYIRYSDQALFAMWGRLTDAVREGTPRWEQTFGLAGPLFSAFFRTDEAMRDFLMGMHGFGMLTSPAIASAFDLSGFRTIIDLGGATGHLAIAACERYPEMRGIVFDLPPVRPLAREQILRSSARDRIQVVIGDFFEDTLPDGDLYALGRILHDWTEEKIARLLGRIYECLPAGGGLLVAERLLNPDGVGPVGANMQSMNMLVCTEGKERSAWEYEELLRAAGFTTVESRVTGTPLDATLARKG
jgi:acetylserotonin O-methyltransferase